MCIRDFGPMNSFWLFSFERYNGILGDRPTNNRSIEAQLLKRFVDDNANLQLLAHVQKSMGDVGTMFGSVVRDHALGYTSLSHLNTELAESTGTPEVTAAKYVIGVLDACYMPILMEIYRCMYPSIAIPCDMPQTYRKTASLTIKSQRVIAGQYVLANPFFAVDTNMQYDPPDIAVSTL